MTLNKKECFKNDETLLILEIENGKIEEKKIKPQRDKKINHNFLEIEANNIQKELFQADKIKITRTLYKLFR